VNLRPSPEQEALGESLDRLLAKLSHPERVREVEERHGGFDTALWAALAELGVPDMATADGGATVRDLAVVAERCGAHLASAPVVEALVAARLGIHGAAFTPAAGALAPWAAVADVVVPDGRRLVRIAATGDPVPTLGCRATGRVERAGGSEVDADPAAALLLWRALTACWLAGLARAALDLGVQYARDRHQFGVPIGSFQTIQHRLADLHTAVDGARLLALDAVAAVDDNDERAAELAATALAWCGEQAEAAAAWSLHVHGGYGFMVEYAIHLYVKRAKAVRLEGGDPRRLLVDVAHLRWDRPVERGLGRGLPAETAAFQREVRAFVDGHVTDELRGRALTSGTMHDWGLHRALAERGWLSAGWPVEVGGQGRSALDVTVLQQALYEAGAPVDGMGIATMVAATLVLLGNDWQRTEVLPKLLAGEALPCLGYSEPDAGSDVAAVATRAVRARSSDGSDDWVIDGQKMFTTMAHEASYVFLLARTSPDKPKHKGLTMFLVPMEAPGISVTPVHTLGGERTNITWYDGVRVPDRCRVGDVDAGWSVMHAALVYERNGANWGEPHGVLEAAAAAADLDDPLVAERLGAAAARDEVGRLLLLRTAWMAAEGGLPQVEGSMAKLFITEWFTAMTSELLDLLGPDAVEHGFFEHAYRHSTVTTIYGGSSEVQRGIIAERGLALPRTR
jgi:alkylation response protein AidB-like acyl-CoA dehydrogenase